jgi:hypothetical protein
MILSGDHTYTLSLHDCTLHSEFMFVPYLFGGNSSLCPKLGCFNWKQGKIGIGTTSSSGAVLQPGGGSGFLPASGDYIMTLYTNHSDATRSFTLNFTIINPQPSMVVKGLKSLTSAASFPVMLVASQVHLQNPVFL